MFQLHGLCRFECVMSTNLTVTRDQGGWVPKEDVLSLKIFTAEIIPVRISTFLWVRKGSTVECKVTT